LPGFGVIEAGLALTGCNLVNVNTGTTAQLPDVSTRLKATATAIAEKGEQDSFIEQPNFSKEFFQKVRQSTFVMQTIDQSKSNEGITTYSGGTSWLLHSEGNDYYFATNRHNLKDFTNGQIRFWRPFIDTMPFSTRTDILYHASKP
jgi:hypothetical protein